MKTFAKWVAELGGVKAAASKIGMSPKTIGAYMRGTRKPSPRVAELIERESGIPRTAWYWPEQSAKKSGYAA
jgi:DNA-binding transcriptional regulator YdaS (Cro superfamily)